MATYKKKVKKIRYIFEYALIITIYYLVRFLPLRILFLLSDVIGTMLFLIPSIKKLCCANLRIAFPEKSEREIRNIAKSSMQNITKTPLELFWFPGRQDYLYKITNVNKEYVRQITKTSLEKGGFMWLSAHLGNWELAAFNASYPDIPVAVIARRQDNPYINNLIAKSRQCTGNRIIYEKGAVREMVKAVRENIALAILIDQNTKVRDGGVFVNFFGLPVPTSKTVAFFARKMNINLVFSVCIREKKSYTILFKELPKPISDYSSDEELTTDIMKITEDMVRQYPEQYLWFYKRWQYIPKDATPELEKKFPYYAKKASQRFYDKRAPKN